MSIILYIFSDYKNAHYYTIVPESAVASTSRMEYESVSDTDSSSDSGSDTSSSSESIDTDGMIRISYSSEE